MVAAAHRSGVRSRSVIPGARTYKPKVKISTSGRGLVNDSPRDRGRLARIRRSPERELRDNAYEFLHSRAGLQLQAGGQRSGAPYHRASHDKKTALPCP